MEIINSIFKLLAGIGLFLFAMFLIEEALKNLSGRNFKLFLQRTTKNKISAASGGALVTAVLQSSSMVSLMVIAFVGAGVFTMKNALAIILGANFGTTIDSWLVATLGFEMNIEVIAYPAVFLGGLFIILFGKRKVFKYSAYFLFGFGLLFIGLSFMKTAMEAQVKVFDFSQYKDMPSILFLFIGFIITLLVQSSSVTMALTLSALHVGAVDFPSAAAIVLGSETGTTMKILLSAIGGSSTKKRVVFGNFLFNFLITILAFIFLHPILNLITDKFQITNPLIELVTFSSIINLFSIILFLPLLDIFAKFLERFFKDTNDHSSAYIANANIDDPETALELFKRETDYFIYNSILFNLEIFDINSDFAQENEELKKINTKKKFLLKSTEEKYDFMKQLQGELQSFYLELRGKLQNGEDSQLNQLNSSIRSAMYSIKCLNDIKRNIDNLQQSSKTLKFNFFVTKKTETTNLYAQLNSVLKNKKNDHFKTLEAIFKTIEKDYTETLNEFYKQASITPIEDIEITTIINFNREVFTSNKAMLMAIKDFIFDEKQAEDFNSIPVYRT
jgi:phosphate:Na+ symporter